jgi:hypothetical protein
MIDRIGAGGWDYFLIVFFIFGGGLGKVPRFYRDPLQGQRESLKVRVKDLVFYLVSDLP